MFFFFCSPSQQQQQYSVQCPNNHAGLLGYPAAIVIGSHYSWDLPFNPGYVIGLLSSVQAGLTPQTGAHLATMQCYHVSTNTSELIQMEIHSISSCCMMKHALFAPAGSPKSHVMCDTNWAHVSLSACGCHEWSPGWRRRCHVGRSCRFLMEDVSHIHEHWQGCHMWDDCHWGMCACET